MVEGCKIGDITPISDTSEWVSLEDAMHVRVNVGPIVGAVACCWRLGQGESSDQFGQKAIQEYRSALCLPKTEAVSEADDARTFFSGAKPKAREGVPGPLAELTEEHYDDGTWATTSGACCACLSA